MVGVFNPPWNTGSSWDLRWSKSSFDWDSDLGKFPLFWDMTARDHDKSMTVLHLQQKKRVVIPSFRKIVT
jgi:hypothetical protein